MSIGVQSFPELYTMLMGWDLYDKLWNLLTQTGLAFLPFIGMILRNVTQSYIAHRDTGQIALRTMEMNLIVTLLLILLAVSPCIPLSAHAVSYSPVCGTDQGQTYHPGDTGTTYDKAFSVPTDNVTIPIWWYAVISVSEGMTNAANTMVGCVPNLRKMVTQVDMAQISDPEVKQEIQDFETMCYMPARTQFNQDKQANNATNLDRIESNVKEYGVEDTEWLGSHGFSDTYYQNLKAARPIPGFPYEANQDINADVNQKNPPAYGPSCKDWWNDSQYGLKNRLYQVLPKSFSDEFKNYLNDVKTHDDVVKRIVSNSSNGFENANTTIGDNGYSHIVSALGIWVHQMEEYPKLYAASQAAPIMQALLLLMIYVFLPFALIFSSYRASAFVTGAMLIFSVIFWGFIWHLVSWTDNALMQALYSGWFSKQSAGATLTDMIIASLVIFSPLFWFIFMGAMGVAIGDIVSGFSMGINKMGERAANKGSEAVKGAATMAGKAALL
jgi:hypothetical protein